MPSRPPLRTVALGMLGGLVAGCVLAWIDHRMHLYVHLVAAVVVVPVGIVEAWRALRGTVAARAPGLTTAAVLATALPLLDLPALAAGLGVHATAPTAASLVSAPQPSASGFTKLSDVETLPRIADKQGLGRACQAGQLGHDISLAACDASLQTWAASTPRWVREHRWSGKWFEPRSRPPVVRAALGALGPGTVLEAVSTSPHDALPGRLSWLLVVLAGAAALGIALVRSSTRAGTASRS